MPIYEYKCEQCGTRVEKLQKISEQPLTVCENCGGKLEKQVSRSGFQFKGEGWYVTDYADKGKSAAKSDPKSEPKAESKTESQGGAEKSSTAESTAKTDSASKSTENKTS